MAPSKRHVQEWLTALGDFHRRREARLQLMALADCPVEPLMAMVADTSLPLNQRWAAVTILGKAKAEAAAPLLVSVMFSEHNLIGDAAAALASITGLDHGSVAEEWAKALGLEVPTEPSGAAESAEAAVEETLAEITPDAEPENTAETLTLDQDGLTGLVKKALGIRAKYVEWDEGGYVHTDVYVRDREQQVLVAPGAAVGADEDQLMIYTECGVIPGLSMENILRNVPPAPIGELETEDVEGGVRLTVRYWLPVAELDARRLDDAVTRVAEYADLIEETLTGQDRV
ncbi:MAG: hypothetical protein RRC34_02420 [Lentisphaeria bacterium]|nr:hypothetical protein [Lentisphaeria bacterium]